MNISFAAFAVLFYFFLKKGCPPVDERFLFGTILPFSRHIPAALTTTLRGPDDKIINILKKIIKCRPCYVYSGGEKSTGCGEACLERRSLPLINTAVLHRGFSLLFYCCSLHDVYFLLAE